MSLVASGTQKTYDGEALFRGLVFLEGDLANGVKILRDIKKLEPLHTLNNPE